MASVFTAIPSPLPPFLTVSRQDEPGTIPIPVPIYPKLAAAPSRVKFSADKSRMAVVTTLRREDLPGIGSPTENVPGGIRVFSREDRFLLTGGTAALGPKLYERVGPGYQNTAVAPLPAAPTFIDKAVFSYGGRWLFATHSNNVAGLVCYRWTAGAWDVPEGEFELFSTIDVGAAIVGLRMSPQNSFVVATTASATFLYRVANEPSLEAPAAIPAGVLLAISPDESEWIFVNGTTVKSYSYDPATEVWTETQTIPHSLASGFMATYSDDGEILVLLGLAVSSGYAQPLFFAKSAGLWTLTRAPAHAGTNAWAPTLPIFARDAHMMGFSFGNTVELYGPDFVLPQPLTYTGNAVPYTQASPNGGGVAVSKARDALARWVNNTPFYGQIWNGSAWVSLTMPTNTGNGNVRCGAVSNGGATWVFGNTSANYIRVFDWDGTSFTARTIAGVAAQAPTRLDISHDGQTIVACYGASPFIEMWERQDSGGVISYQKVGTIFGGIAQAQTLQPRFNAQGDRLAIPAATTANTRIMKKVAGVWSVHSDIARGGSLPAVAWHPDGTALAIAFDGGAAGSGAPDPIRIYKENAGGTAYEQVSGFTVPENTAPDFLEFSEDGQILAMVGGSPALQCCYVNPSYQMSLITEPPAFIQTDAVGCYWTAGDVAFDVVSGVAGTANGAHYTVNIQPGLPTLQLLHTATGGTSSQIWGFSPEGAILHAGTVSTPLHLETTTPFDPVDGLVWAGDWTLADISEVLYSPSGDVVIFRTPNGLEAAIRSPRGGDYVNAKDINGVFVNLYDMVQERFRERAYVQHVLDAQVKDIQFSDQLTVMAYHVNLPPDAPALALRGRLIFDVTGALEDDPELARFDYRGAVYDEEMVASFIAFSPWGTHFVVARDREVGPSLSLHSFLPDYYFTQDDEELVAYGPPDFSRCDDVVVAHGGEIPFTFFKHNRTTDTLDASPITVDWESGGVVLDVLFKDDCSGLVVLLPDEIIVLEPNPDNPEVLEPTTEDPLDEPLDEEEENEIEETEDPVVIIVSPGPIPEQPQGYDGGGGGGGYNSLTYIPYSSVSVTFRVMPVPL